MDVSIYQIEMIKKKIIRGIVKMDVIDNDIEFDMTGLNKIDKLKFKHLISIIKILKNADRYYFYKNNFILDQEKIYHDNTKEIKLLYIPIKDKKIKSKNIESLISSSINIKFLRKELIEFSRTENMSFLSYESKKIMYIAIIISLTCILSIYFKWVALLLPLLLVVSIAIKKREVKKPKQKVEIDDRTIILSDRDKMTICFSDMFGNENEVSIAEYENKYIGRDKKACSLYISNNAVGRRHAKLTFQDGKIQISDNDSINNTYLNDTKLKKNKQYEMKDGDKVVFANEEYMIFLKK